jgi:hypothetical protein
MGKVEKESIVPPVGIVTGDDGGWIVGAVAVA